MLKLVVILAGGLQRFRLTTSLRDSTSQSPTPMSSDSVVLSVTAIKNSIISAVSTAERALASGGVPEIVSPPSTIDVKVSIIVEFCKKYGMEEPKELVDLREIYAPAYAELHKRSTQMSTILEEFSKDEAAHWMTVHIVGAKRKMGMIAE